MSSFNSARREALREFHADNGTSSKRPWLIKPPKIDFAMVRVIYGVIDHEGQRLELSTWSVGANAKSAERRWVNRRNDLGLPINDYRIEIVSEKSTKTHHVQTPIGERADPSIDTMTEYLAATA